MGCWVVCLFWRKNLRENVNGLLVATLTLELYYPGNFSKQRIVFALTYVVARVYARPPLTHDDTAGGNSLAPIGFYSKPLTVGIPTIA
jgi:hypothetical protein